MIERSLPTSRTMSRRKRNSISGMSLIEMMIALAVLAIGMSALLGLIVTAIGNNNKAKVDTGGTLVAQMVVEQMLAQPTSPTLIIQDCNAQDWTISSVDGGSPGAGATLTSSGGVDFTQAYASVPANYKMQFRSCGANGGWTVYDVRWNVQTVTANRSRLVTVSARPTGFNTASNSARTRLFQVPVTLRTIVSSQN
jgi:prepilin-type N-terminal cleavage/methylation domain-containing protein